MKEPHPKSLAARVLLTRQLQEQERAQWVEFRARFLARMLSRQGDLQCHYCGRKGLVTDVPDVPTRAELRSLATLDHVIPRSKGGAEMDEKNIVVACFSCNQKKADNENLDPILLRG